MSHTNEEESDLAPTQTEGYHLSQKQSLQHYANLDPEDEALNKWKASLGITQTAGSTATEPSVSRVPYSLFYPTSTHFLNFPR